MSGRPIVILIAGGHACGKTEATKLLETNLHKRFEGIKVKSVDLSHYEEKGLEIGDHRLSNPSRFDFTAVNKEIQGLVNESKYDIIIVNGLYALYDKALLSLGTLKIFIDCDADVRIGRWIKRDVLHDNGNDKRNNDSATATATSESSRLLQRLLALYLNHSKLEMNDFIFQTKQFADIILPRGAELGSTGLIIDGLQPLLLNPESGSDLNNQPSVILKRSNIPSLNTGLKKRFYNLS